MKKKFTVQDILGLNPCSSYTEERITELFKSVGCKKYVTVDKLFKANIPHQDFFWLILRPEFISERQLHEIAIWCFERIARPIWEKYYPNDNRPQEAIRIKKLWLDKKATNKELAAASAAARAAVWAAARAAVWAARAAAEDAASDAVWAAVWAARAAVWAAAEDAASAAAEDAVWAAASAAAEDAASDAASDAVWAKTKNDIRKILEK